MEIACLAASPEILDNAPFIMEATIRSLAGCRFIINKKHDNLVALLGKYNCTYEPVYSVAKATRRVDAGEDQARRMVKYATQCHIFVAEMDYRARPFLVALEFNRQHPTYMLNITFYTREKEVILQTIQELKARYKWY